jgi:pyruvate-formate lyase-activating enzyme
MELTGNSNTAVLESIRYLAEINMLYEVRLLIVPGFNDSQESVSSTAKWLRSIDPAVPLKVMGHRTHGTRPIAAKLAEPSHDDIVAIGDRFRSEGFANVTVI